MAWEILSSRPSSQIFEMHKDPQDSSEPGATVKLRVKFSNGATYDYKDIPNHVLETVLAAPSLGSAFDSHIKKGGYKYERVGT